MDQVMQWFGVENYKKKLDTVRRFWGGEGRYIISTYASEHAYRQNFDDAEILANAPLHLHAQARLPGMNLPSFFADFGTVSTAKYWGGAAHFDSTGTNMFVDPIAHTVDQALKLHPLAVDHPLMDVSRGLRLYRQVKAQLDTDVLWLRTPDMQGTLNTAGLIVDQEELLMSMHSDKARVHALLDKVSDFLVEYALYLREQTNHRVCGNIWPFSFLPDDLGISLTEDLMPLLSVPLYKEFGLPYLAKIHDRLGGLLIHCCGDWGRHARSLGESGLAIRAVEFHYPATRLEELAPLGAGVVLIPYILLHRQSEYATAIDYYTHLLETGNPKQRFWFACADDLPETLAFVAKYGEFGA